jgi:hypothetical protein
MIPMVVVILVGAAARTGGPGCFVGPVRCEAAAI